MAKTKKLIKKETQKKVFEKLSGALAEFKDGVNEKKFENKIKKASRLLAADIVKSAKKIAKPAKKEKKIKK